ncbi:MAG: family lipase [Mucilaginibacter sp.]|jgi:lysophospholipase L1-like esterase|nr:family lipase [Mucilaginibacter sp.]MDB5018203.1 family lipase [Mucilaginibacter sp.]MDB5140925.1 family lipase [Mucilaginibacter sp.]
MYWYEDEVKRLEKESLEIGTGSETVFYGSSSIRLWISLYDDFKALKPVNLGFGGSTLAACVWFFERVMASYQPKRLIVYAGDNDLGDGRNPEEVFIFFQQLVVKTKKRFGDIPCYFISLKPSISRWQMIDQFKYTNSLIENEIIKQNDNWQFIDIFKVMIDPGGKPKKENYLYDGLHLSEKGYQLWKQVINDHINANH